MFSLRRTAFLEDSFDTMLYLNWSRRSENCKFHVFFFFFFFCYFSIDSCRQSWTPQSHKFEMTPLHIVVNESD